jgi:hypothetical protein
MIHLFLGVPMSEETAQHTQMQLRELLEKHSPAEAAGQLLERGRPPLEVLNALVLETKPAVVGALDELVRERAKGPLPPDYEAYVALQTAKEGAPAHTIDRDNYAVTAAQRAGHSHEALSVALPYVVDLPSPDLDRKAVASLLLMPAFERPSVYVPERGQPSYVVSIPLATYAIGPELVLPDPAPRQTPASAPEARSSAGPRPALEHEPRAPALAAQLGALDADRHQVVVRAENGAVQFLAPDKEGKGFVTTDKPTYLSAEQVLAALPAIEGLNRTANVDLVSESSRHHYVRLDGLDARQARDLDDRFGANLVMKVGDDHVAVVRLSEDPERAAAAASLLRARYPSGPDEGTPPSEHAGARTVELVLARTEDFLPALPRGKDTALPGTDDSPAATIERFAQHRAEAERTYLMGGLLPEPERLDGAAARRMVSEGYSTSQVTSAIEFASQRPGEEALDRTAYARETAEAAVQARTGTPRAVHHGQEPEVGGR